MRDSARGRGTGGFYYATQYLPRFIILQVLQGFKYASIRKRGMILCEIFLFRMLLCLSSIIFLN